MPVIMIIDDNIAPEELPDAATVCRNSIFPAKLSELYQEPLRAITIRSNQGQIFCWGNRGNVRMAIIKLYVQKWDPEFNQKVSDEMAPLLKKELDLDPENVVMKFYELDGENFGYKGKVDWFRDMNGAETLEAAA